MGQAKRERGQGEGVGEGQRGGVAGRAWESIRVASSALLGSRPLIAATRSPALSTPHVAATVPAKSCSTITSAPRPPAAARVARPMPRRALVCGLCNEICSCSHPGGARRARWAEEAVRGAAWIETSGTPPG